MSLSVDSAFTTILPQLTTEDTAFIVHDLDVVSEYTTLLQSAFPSSVHHAVAIKTMPHPRVLSFLARSGLGLEAASFEEVQLAAVEGIDPGRLIFDSPVKTRSEIDVCSSLYPGMLMNANSIAELGRYDWADQPRVGLRINPLVQTGVSPHFDVSAGDSKFGVPADRCEAIIAAGVEHDFTALHMHIGSGLTDAVPYVDAARLLVSLANSVNEARGPRRPQITVLDIGGGLAPEPLSADTAMMNCAKRLAEECPELFGFEVWTEFGQWVHANAGWAASRVEYVEDRERPMAFLHLGADYLMRTVYGHGPEHRYRIYSPEGVRREGAERGYDLAGPLCFAGDMVDRDVRLPEIQPGDWLLIESTGANTYGLWSRHCSRALPRMFGVERGQVAHWDVRRSAPT